LLLWRILRGTRSVCRSEATTSRQPQLLAAIDLRSASELQPEALCRRFERPFISGARARAGALIPDVQAIALRVNRSAFRRAHHARTTLQAQRLLLAVLSRAFRSSMRMSIRELHGTHQSGGGAIETG
jgi:hypothetical protein